MDRWGASPACMNGLSRVVSRGPEALNMRPLLFIVFVGLSAASRISSAEGGCPSGLMPTNASVPEGSAASLASCAPIPEGPNARKWQSRWGAVATDDHGIFGIVTGQRSERSARSSATAECKRRGGSPCIADFTFRNQCAVVVSSSTVSYAQGAATEKEAEAIAMPRCKASNSGECWVYYSGCSLPVRVR